MTLAASGRAEGAGPQAWRTATRLAGAAAVLHALFCLPNHPDGLTVASFLRLPHELPLLLAGLVALPAGRMTRAVRVALVGVLFAAATVKLADLATYAALDRPFHPFLDLHLVASAWHLGSGVIGWPLAFGAAAGALLVALAVVAALWWATGVWARVRPPRPGRIAAGALAGAAAVVVALDVGDATGAWTRPVDLPGHALTSRLGAERIADYGEAVARLRSFAEAAADDPWAGTAPVLDRLDGHDVLVIFVESYGAASLQNPTYVDTHAATLSRIEADLASRGLEMRSAWLDAPTSGGQSWLSHATLSSGLWIDNQRSYGAWLASPRLGLFDLAQQAGYATVAVMPAITMDWPESALMGFDRILDAASLGYRGPAFNWVTMPDQFTLAAFDRLVRDRAAAPLFAQIALISSHAPWVPVPELVPWDAVGDGRVFARWADAGDPPEVVWRDRDRVREQYRRAVDYALGTVGAYAARHADAPALTVVLGDHQAAGFIAQSSSTAVPIHVIGPPELVRRLDGWGWDAGLVPGEAAPLWPMSAVRDRFVAAFSSARPGA
jgi:hypothetical protein